jgi:hypothetical protein
LPDVVPKVTVMLVVPAPAVIVAPAGTLHTYPVALGIAAMLYTFPVLLTQTLVGPVMAPAWGIGGHPETNERIDPLVVPKPFTPTQRK